MAKPKTPTLSEAFKQGQGFAQSAATCPHCSAVSVLRPLGHTGCNLPWPGRAAAKIDTVRPGYCVNCSGLVIGVSGYEGPGHPVGELLWPLDTWPDRAPDNLDKDIRKAYDEARAVLALSPMAAAVLARRCLQHVIRRKLGIERARLFDEIAEAEKREELAKPTRNALHHVRNIGNWGAHPTVDQASTIIDVKRGEAAYTLEALEMVFDDLYVAPARTKAMAHHIARRKRGSPKRRKSTKRRPTRPALPGLPP